MVNRNDTRLTVVGSMKTKLIKLPAWLLFILLFFFIWQVYIWLLMLKFKRLFIFFAISIIAGFAIAVYTNKPNFLLFYFSVCLGGFFIAKIISVLERYENDHIIERFYSFIANMAAIHLGLCVGFICMYLLEFTYLVWALLTYR